MLLLTRKKNESIKIYDKNGMEAWIRIMKISQYKSPEAEPHVLLGLDFPTDLHIERYDHNETKQSRSDDVPTVILKRSKHTGV